MGKKMGRPPIPKRDLRSHLVTVRFTGDELHSLRARARQAGCTIADLLRMVVQE